MIRRVALTAATAALAVLAAGAFAWNDRVAWTGSLLDTQLATTRAFISTPTVRNDPASLLAIAGRPEINVSVRDLDTGAIYNYVDGASAAAPAGMPPDAGGPPGTGGPPGPPGPPPQQRQSLAMLAAGFAHLAPRRVRSGALAVTLVPSARSLASWFFADLVLTGLVLAAIAVTAWGIAATLARAAREPLLRTTAALEGLAGGNFAPQSIEAGDSPEIARLARAYNAAAETVARSIEERRAAAAEFQRFLADAGHELRTPLTIVGGYIDILGAGPRNADATGRRAIAGMTAETARMRALVEKMLLLSRLESTNGAPRVVDVASVARDAAEAMRPSFPERAILVRCDGDARVHIDEDDLFEAARNLVENALRYAPESPVEVRAFARDGRVAIEVSDQGPGIPEGEQSMVFERFYRGKDRTGSEGSGLGLAIVRRVVERWGGTLSLDSNERGTCFTMYFPLAESGA